MWIKKTKSKGIEYIQIVNSIRDGDKVKHEVVLNLGRSDKISNRRENIKDLISNLQFIIGEKPSHAINGEANISNYGYFLYKKIFEQLSIDKILLKISEQYPQFNFDIVNSTLKLIIDRLFSVNLNYNNKEQYYQMSEFQLEQLNETLEVLADHKEEIEKHLYSLNYKLSRPSMAYYYLTKFTFKQSVNSSSNYIDIILGLVIKENGNPVCYKLFDGSNFDIDNLTEEFEYLNHKYRIERVTLVSDDVMYYNDKIYDYLRNNDDYIVSMKYLSSIKNIILDEKGYTNIPNPSDEIDNYKYKITEITKIIEEIKKVIIEKKSVIEKTIFTYSEQRAKINKKHRISVPNHLVESEKFSKQESLLDGFKIICSNSNFEALDIINQFHKLLETKRIFQKSQYISEKNIQGHFVIAFMALSISKVIEDKLKEKNIKIRFRDLNELLSQLNIVELNNDNDNFIVTQKIDNKNIDEFEKLVQISISKDNKVKVRFKQKNKTSN